jgi:hypothetical protein
MPHNAWRFLGINAGEPDKPERQAMGAGFDNSWFPFANLC